jgi:hypothetical protein
VRWSERYKAPPRRLHSGEALALVDCNESPFARLDRPYPYHEVPGSHSRLLGAGQWLHVDSAGAERLRLNATQAVQSNALFGA